MILALANNKGGVAKTTTATNLAAGLVRSGKRVLLVDLDSQGSASLSLGVKRHELAPSSADVLLHGMDVRRAIRKADGIDLLTGSMELANADLALADVRNREVRVRTALESVRNGYDFVVVDCPPSLSLLTINALVAADAFIVPVVPQYLALEGLANLMEAIDRIRDGIGMKADLMGILVTMADYRNKATGEIVGMIRGHFGKKVFKTEIRVNVRLSEAPSYGKNIFEYDPASVGAEGYGELTVEVLEKVRKDGRKEGRKQ